MKRKQRATKQAKAKFLEHDRAPLLEHLYELRRRLFIVAVSVAVGSAIGYGVEQRLVNVLLHPSNGQKFIYTSPLGGINFIFSVCIYVGIALSIPVIVYQLLRFLQPMMKDTTAKFIGWCSFASAIVAILGIMFGYFIGLPAALHVLLHQFPGTNQIEALLTIQSYLSFVTAYLFGSAMMFQLPLILLFINRIKPLKPSKMFKYERHIIVFAVIGAFIMNPSPNIIDQLLVVVPFVVMYQLGIGMIWLINRNKHTERYSDLLHEDENRWAERREKAYSLTPVLNPADDTAELLRSRKRFVAEFEPAEITTAKDEMPAAVIEQDPATEQTEVATPPAGRIRPRNNYDVIGGNLVTSLAAPAGQNYRQVNVRLVE